MVVKRVNPFTLNDDEILHLQSGRDFVGGGYGRPTDVERAKRDTGNATATCSTPTEAGGRGKCSGRRPGKQ